MSRKRIPMHPRHPLLLPAMLLATLGATDPARAGAVTAPSGGTHSATAPLTVQWNGIGGSSGNAGTVGFELTGVAPGGAVATVPLLAGVPNTGQHAIPPAAYRNLACTLLPQILGFGQSLYTYTSVPSSQIQFHVLVRATGASSYAIGTTFRIKCPPAIDKLTASHGELGPVARPGGRPFIGPISHFTGTLAGAVITLPPEPTSGWARVQKIVVNDTGGDVAMPSSFSIGGLCSGGQANSGGMGLGLVGLTVPVGAGQWQTFGASSDSTCSAFETPPAPIADAKGCEGGRTSWTVNIAPAQVYRNGASTDITVTNTLACDRPVPATGSLVVVKQVESDSGIPPPDVNFLVDVDCQPGGPRTTVKLNRAGGLRETVGGIRFGSNCTITEQPPEVPADLARRGCHWETSYPGERRVPVATREGASLTVVNRWVCKDGVGRQGKEGERR